MSVSFIYTEINVSLHFLFKESKKSKKNFHRSNFEYDILWNVILCAMAWTFSKYLWCQFEFDSLPLCAIKWSKMYKWYSVLTHSMIYNDRYILAFQMFCFVLFWWSMMLWRLFYAKKTTSYISQTFPGKKWDLHCFIYVVRYLVTKSVTNQIFYQFILSLASKCTVVRSENIV